MSESDSLRCLYEAEVIRSKASLQEANPPFLGSVSAVPCDFGFLQHGQAEREAANALLSPQDMIWSIGRRYAIYAPIFKLRAPWQASIWLLNISVEDS